MRTLPLSTITMTAYNWLAVDCDGPRSIADIELGLCGWAAQGRVALSRSQLAAAVTALVKRGLLRRHPICDALGADLFDVVDRERRPVVSRDRNDADQPDPGWRGWRVSPRRPVRSRPIEQVIHG